MQFYPHNISVNLIGNSVSASVALTGSLINNFSSIAINIVNTASIALNITGSRGTDGTSIASYGPKGEQGDRGVTGFRGNNIFLLSASWSASACGAPPITCNSYTLYNIGPGLDECNTNQGSGTYYVNANSGIVNSSVVGTANGYIIYTNSGCTSPASNISVHNTQGVIFYTDYSGVISTTGCGS